MDYAEAVRAAIVATVGEAVADDMQWHDAAFDKTVAYLQGTDYSIEDLKAEPNFAYTVYDILAFSL
jgi:hypothetical protein